MDNFWKTKATLVTAELFKELDMFPSVFTFIEEMLYL